MLFRTTLAALLILLAAAGCQKKEEERPPIRFYGSTVLKSADFEAEKTITPIGERVFENQNGEKVSLNGLNGSPALISYIFTRCPTPAMCPSMSQRVAEVQRELNEAERKRIRLISMTFDTAFDTAEVLKSYGEAFHADFECWEFWRGGPEDVEALMTKSLAWAEPSADTFVHNPVSVILDGTGRVVESLPGSNWDAKAAAESLRQLLNDPNETATEQPIAERSETAAP